MNPWLAFGIGLFIGLLVGLFASWLGRAAKDDEFNELGEYKCDYPADRSLEVGTIIPSDVTTPFNQIDIPIIIASNASIMNHRGLDNSIYLMPNDGFDYLHRRKMNDEDIKKFFVIRFVGKDKESEAKD
ncbi:MAG: hypothetical protein CVU42_13780 [Chloroflexi bacterium HGW-Chloroflexi-4]|jgi:hypothetical protein|nr:MAG: hypothetical protein CVU42_13780 [Chloroflexi bacterium HGW-Chloroflexi-4]